MVLEFIRRRATKLVKGLESLYCVEWLSTLGLSSSAKRRLRNNFIALHSFLKKGYENGDACLFSLVSSARKCMGNMRRYRLDIRKYFLSEEVGKH